MRLVLQIISELSVSVTSSSIESGLDATLTCSSEATDAGTDIVWYRADSGLSNRGDAFTIVTTLGTETENDGLTIISTSTLTINAFDAADVAPYSCAVNYILPILDDSSQDLSMSILGTC